MVAKELNKSVLIQLMGTDLQAQLVIPPNAKGIIIFSHGSGSSRLSPRNNYVARFLQKRGLGTLLVDLLSEKEDMIYENRFDIELLTDRLLSITRWVKGHAEVPDIPFGYFGASTGAASALGAASFLKEEVFAVVSRGGRPDLAIPLLPDVTAPTLLIVGSKDHSVIKLNQKAALKLRCKHRLEIIPEASHLFEEPGKLEEVAEVSADWFLKCLKE